MLGARQMPRLFQACDRTPKLRRPRAAPGLPVPSAAVGRPCREPRLGCRGGPAALGGPRGRGVLLQGPPGPRGQRVSVQLWHVHSLSCVTGGEAGDVSEPQPLHE